MMRKNSKTYHPEYHKLSDFGSWFRSICLALPWVRAVFCDLVFGTSAEAPLGPMLASPGAPLVQLSSLF